MSDGQHSKFTFAQFESLRKYSTTNPLRVIAHIDLDAFYAQCETVRLGLDPNVPLACQQWQGLIAVNYAARKFGISRHETITEARKKCPGLVLAHVATWKEGDAKWDYHDNPDIATHKVSLDPYRRQSQLIFKIFYDSCGKVEYGGLDEAFLDLSMLVYEKACAEYSKLAALLYLKQEEGRMNDFMPLPEISQEGLTWDGELVPLDPDKDTPDRAVDWDDVLFMLGSKIIKGVRNKVRYELKYTCSAGIAQNRVLGKLCSAYKKPNNQTILRHDAVRRFIATLNFSKIRGLGGKLGHEISRHFSVPEDGSIPFLLQISLQDFVLALGDETGNWLYNIIRGRDASDVKPRTEIKSMLSAKNFRPNIVTYQQAEKWLRIFVADIMGRILEFGNSTPGGAIRIPKTLVLHHRHANAGSSSRQIAIPACQSSNLEDTLFHTAKVLYRQIEKEKEGSMYPCYQMSMAVSGFDSTVSRNHAIEGFLVKSATKFEDVEESVEREITQETSVAKSSPSKKGSIDEFLGREQQLSNNCYVDAGLNCQDTADGKTASAIGDSSKSDSDIDSFVCSDCAKRIKFEDAEEHQDWHFALSVAKKFRQEKEHQSQPSVPPPISQNEKRDTAVKRKAGNSVCNGPSSKGPKLEKGQRKLFG
ncbi:hypothetical protein V1520DRAFT_276257 [Lipomyces starkeyi]|uniref:DNA polymerase eta n=1 Tax=Lipomyces starkeyi NRRL Y-11557 TaxID=675824 RepID=A0A1E3PXX1_LIPST|nr:hypothetical protein LIPSTDRAFT_75137 [Lipomyces starkeyi NRRL Y-11557]